MFYFCLLTYDYLVFKEQGFERIALSKLNKQAYNDANL